MDKEEKIRKLEKDIANFPNNFGEIQGNNLEVLRDMTGRYLEIYDSLSQGESTKLNQGLYHAEKFYELVVRINIKNMAKNGE